MKKIFVLLSSALLLLSACSSKTTSTENEKKEEKLNVVTTIFPQYDFTREIAKDNINLKMLLKPGSESHSYEPTPQDMKDIQAADLFIYVGGENEIWVEDLLESLGNNKPDTIKLVDLVPTVEEIIVEGMEHNHEHHHEEIHEENIKDRELINFKGKYLSLIKHIQNGLLDEAIEEHAKEENEDFSEVKEEFINKFASEYENIEVNENGIILNEREIHLKYNSFKAIKDDDGEIESVWYIFESDASPKYIAFSDHQINESQSADEVKHMHVLFINDINEIEKTENIPFYVDINAADEKVSKILSHHHEHGEIDEHVWTSPVNAIEIVKAISTKLVEKDSLNSEAYKINTEEYINKLEKLHQEFINVVKNTNNKTLIFGDRFPFRYFADEYGLNYYAAFTGCSNETEASAQTVAFLIDKTKEENIPVVFSIELSNGKIANSIAEATGAKRLTLYSCHNITKDELEAGESYLSMMQKNVESLKEALK